MNTTKLCQKYTLFDIIRHNDLSNGNETRHAKSMFFVAMDLDAMLFERAERR